MKEYKEWLKGKERYECFLSEAQRKNVLEGFRHVYEQQPVVEADWLDVKIEDLDKTQILHLEKELEKTKENMKTLNAENIRLRKQCETLASDNKRLENEVNRLNQSLDAFSKIQIMDAAEIEHWKSTVEAIVKSDQKANYLPRTAIVSIAKNALKGVPK